MAVNSTLIYERLDDCIDKKLNAFSTRRPITYLTIYNPAIPVKSNTAYIVPDRHLFPLDTEGTPSLLIVSGKPDPKAMAASIHECICVRESCGLGKLYENVMEIIEYYKVWEEKMENILLKNGTLCELCKASVPYFGNPLTIQDENFKILDVGESDDVKYPYAFRESNSDYLSEKWIDSALSQEQKVFSRRDPFAFHYIPEHLSLLYNIFEGSHYRFQICVDANHQDLVREDAIRITILGNYIQKFFEINGFKPKFQGNHLRTQLLAYLTGNRKARKALEVSLRFIGWKATDTYQCGIVMRNKDPLSDMGIDYFSQKWEEGHSACISFTHQNMICLLINRTRDTQENSQALLQQNGVKYHCTVGLSTPFNHFFDFPLFLTQAKAAIKIGLQDRNAAVLYPFEQYRLNYIVKHGIASLPIKALIPEKINDLILYDQQNQRELCKTLIVYLKNNMNIPNSVKELYLHRSTFIYRLNRIKEITAINFENKKECLYLELLFFEIGGPFMRQAEAPTLQAL